MKLRALLAWTIAVFCLGQFAVLSQVIDEKEDDPLNPVINRPPILIGPVAGINIVNHTSDLSSLRGPVACPIFKSGSATGFYVGMTGEYLLGDVKNAKSSVILKLVYQSTPARFIETGDKLPSLVTKPGQPKADTVISTVDHKKDVEYSMIAIQPFYRFNLGGTRLGITFGVDIGIPMNATDNQTFNLIDPIGARFAFDPDQVGPDKLVKRYSTDARTAFIKEGDIVGASGMRLGLIGGLQYELTLGRMLLVPHLLYNFGITNVTTGADAENWKVSMLQIGADLRFAL